jgi:hypothetical protein
LEATLPTSAAAAGLTLTIVLLVSGGFSMPVVTLLWLTTTFVLGASARAESDRGSIVNVDRWGPHSAVGGASLLAACLWTAWGPVTLCGMYLNAGNAALHTDRRAVQAVTLLQSAAAADRLDPQPWRELSFAHTTVASSSGPNADRQFTAAVEAAQEAISRDPFNSHGYRWLGELWLSRAADPAFPVAAQNSAGAYQRAVELAPQVSRMRADLARALTATGRSADARAEARIALSLDLINQVWRHFDKTFSIEERAALQSLAETADADRTE